jgi:hypothetical protein
MTHIFLVSTTASLGVHPTGNRGYAIGDIMFKGTTEEILYFGLGQTRYQDENGTFISTPRWGFNDDGSYTLANRSTYPRLNDLYSFDGSTEWKRLADFPGIGRTHPAMIAIPGKVYVGMGFGELCPQPEVRCCRLNYVGHSS